VVNYQKKRCLKKGKGKKSTEKEKKSRHGGDWKREGRRKYYAAQLRKNRREGKGDLFEPSGFSKRVEEKLDEKLGIGSSLIKNLSRTLQ